MKYLIGANVSLWSEIFLIVLFLLFVALIWMVYRPSARKSYDHAAALPFDERNDKE